MATLIPAIGSCRFTGGERGFARRLEQKLEDDYLLWFDVPVGPANAHPDFVILHPQRGVLILEVKDWKQGTLISADKTSILIHSATGPKRVVNPLEQARQYAHAVANCLSKDPQLVVHDGTHQGGLLFPWSYGVVFTNLSRAQFTTAALDQVIEPHRALCQDEMTEGVDAGEFQQRLWEMFSVRFASRLSLPQIDRIRWHLFPEIRIAPQRGTLFDEEPTAPPSADAGLPDLMRVMDLQQEQLARSLGDGHRVIHGVAGSGKTLILGYRAMHLAQACTRPILVLCYNRQLANKLTHSLADARADGKVVVQTFHQWCAAQLRAFNVPMPTSQRDQEKYFESMVAQVIDAVARRQIPSGQYDALLIDEGHDFKPEWFKLVVQMVNPASNSLLVLYDDAQSIYHRTERRKFSFKSVGIEAQGRTTVFKINYRNTDEILRVAAAFADDLLTSREADDDHVPTVRPVSLGRKGPAPLLIRLPTIDDEARWIVAQLQRAHRAGTPWSSMAVLYREYRPTGRALHAALRKAEVPLAWQRAVRFESGQERVKLMTLHSAKGLEFPLVAMAGLGAISAENAEQLRDEATLIYVGMTRSTEALFLTRDRNTPLGDRLAQAIGEMSAEDFEGLYLRAADELRSSAPDPAVWSEVLAATSASVSRASRNARYVSARVEALRRMAVEQLRVEAGESPTGR